MKTWETLFHLSSFMKYLLREVLPGEKVDCPLYVLHSLHELLKVTEGCINKVQNELQNITHEVFKNDRKNKRDEEFERINSYRNDGKVDIRNTPIQNKGDLPSAHSPTLPSKLDLQNSTHREAFFSNHESSREQINIPLKFMQLSTEMISGRPYGYYCNLCSLVTYSKEFWDKHMYKSHSSWSNEVENKDAKCSECNLYIFAKDTDSKQLISYHELQHFESEKKSNVENYPHKHGTNISVKLVNNEVKKSGETDTGFLNTEPCNNNHKKNQFGKQLQPDSNKGHIENLSGSDRFVMLNSSNEIIRKLISHNSAQEGNEDLDQDSRENMSSPSSFTSGSNPTYDYDIVKRFKHFNAHIHARKLQGCFYCRPCNESIKTEEEWLIHCRHDKHLELMNNWKYKNWVGQCSYCSLTIVATEKVLDNYMDFHTKDHKKLLSYNKKLYYATMEEKIDANSTFKPKKDKNFSFKKHRNVIQNKRRTSNNNSYYDSVNESKNNSLSNFGEEEASIVNYEEEHYDINVSFTSKDLDLQHAKNLTLTKSVQDLSTEDVDSTVQHLINSRLEQMDYGSLEFQGLCMICRLMFSNGFSWEDHLNCENHSRRISTSDCHVMLKDLNLNFFGNFDDLKKYERLLNGRTSFNFIR